MNQVVMQITTVRLSPAARRVLSGDICTRIDEWLRQWTAPNNYKAVIAANELAALAVLRADLQATLVPWWMRDCGAHAAHFQFEVSTQVAEDGRFWMSSSIRTCHWHDVGSPA